VNDELRRLVADVLGVDVREVTDELGPGVSDTWDSISHLRIVSAIEDELSLRLTMDEIRSVDSFARLAAIVAAKGRSA
jgi:acyl carrier protein